MPKSTFPVSVYQALGRLPEIQLIYSRRIMEKFRKQNLWQAAAYLFCTGVLWIHLDAFGGSEFSGGHITGKLFTMAELASLLFSVALLSKSCSRYRLSSHAALFAVLPLHLDAGALPANIQVRICCPAPKTLCLEQLGGCRSAWHHDCHVFEPLQSFQWASAT
jgi:hypothetical protein